MTDEVTKLNLGAGKTQIEGFTPIDRKLGTEVYPLDYPDDSVDEIRASHVVEHFSHDEVIDVLTDWVRALKPGGRMRIAVPNFAHIAEAYHRGLDSPDMLFSYAMGGQTDENDFHKSLFDEGHLRKAMRLAGLSGIRDWSDGVSDCSVLPVSLNLEGCKRPPRNPVEIPKIVGLMSTAKLGFTENMFCVHHHCHRLGIDLIKHTGAFWGQCLERVMDQAIDMGAEWILTFDYDTVFSYEHIDELLHLMATHPEADAIAPWQMKREEHRVMAFFLDEQGRGRSAITRDELDRDLIPVGDAHFGMTVLRVSALQKMKHPWFQPIPDQDGKWGDHRIDEDISFWRKWKELGNTLFIAGHISIGHLQQVATWPDEHLHPLHQFITDFQQNGPPLGAKQ